jgi:hypothetical protein
MLPHIGSDTIQIRWCAEVESEAGSRFAVPTAGFRPGMHNFAFAAVGTNGRVSNEVTVAVSVVRSHATSPASQSRDSSPRSSPVQSPRPALPATDTPPETDSQPTTATIDREAHGRLLLAVLVAVPVVVVCLAAVLAVCLVKKRSPCRVNGLAFRGTNKELVNYFSESADNPERLVQIKGLPTDVLLPSNGQRFDLTQQRRSSVHACGQYDCSVVGKLGPFLGEGWRETNSLQ